MGRKTVVITGASTGIGAAAAIHLATRGWSVFAGVRKRTDAEALLQAAPGIEPLILDVTRAEEIAAAVDSVSAALGGARLCGLVNNAGIAMLGPLALQPMEEVRAHFEVNTFGLLATTKAFLPLLGTEAGRTGAPGRIVNVTSVGGRLASPFLGAYTATKHAVESLTDSLRRELVVYGIDAIAVGPGAVKTPIWSKADARDPTAAYSGSPWAGAIARFWASMLEAGETGLPAGRVAAVIETALSSRRPKARYAPVPNRLVNFTLPLLLPRRMVDRAFWKRFGMGPPDGR